MIRDTRLSLNRAASAVAGTLLVAFAAACAENPTGVEPSSRTFDEVTMADLAPEPCGPGYWKNNTTSDAWDPTGYAPDQLIGQLFDGSDPYATYLLVDALQFGGAKGVNGGKVILLRAAVAAILNAAHPDIGYGLSVGDLTGEVEAALASGQRKAMLALAKELDAFNEACVVGPSDPGPEDLPDLIVTQVDFFVTDLGQLRRNVTVMNVGTASVDVQNVVIQGFHSVDTILDGDDAAAGGRVLSGSPLVLAPGASMTVSTGGNPPAEGHLYLLQIVDYGDTVVESDETNNMAAVALPDL